MTISPRFLKRVLSAIAIAPIFLFLLFYARWTFFLVLAAAFAIAAYEWIQMVRCAPRPHKIIIAVMGMLYIPACFYAFTILRLSTVWEKDTLGKMLILLLILGVWASDTGGYVVGKLVGGPKLIPAISPNKTWAGFVGALTFPLIILVPFTIMYEGLHALSGAGILWLVGASCLIGAAGQAGDLMISAVKRLAGVKDTGSLIPGHGGLLDRIDSLMLAAIVTYIVLINLS